MTDNLIKKQKVELKRAMSPSTKTDAESTTDPQRIRSPPRGM